MNTCAHPGCRRRVMPPKRNPSQLCDQHRPKPPGGHRPSNPEAVKVSRERAKKRSREAGVPAGWL
jgi:hypothetical protein